MFHEYFLKNTSIKRKKICILVQKGIHPNASIIPSLVHLLYEESSRKCRLGLFRPQYIEQGSKLSDTH